MMTQRYRQQSRCWWRVLSVFANPGLWIHIAEHTLSPPPRNSFLLSLSTPPPVLSPTFFAVIPRGLLGITAPFFLSLNFCLSFPFPRSVPLRPPFISHPWLWSGTYRSVHYQDWFVTRLFSHFHTIVTLMKLRGRSCCGCWFHSRTPTRRISTPHLLLFPLEPTVIDLFFYFFGH